MADTNIEWTDRVWNPVTGCTKVSQGCRHCYAETVANRFWHKQYEAVEIEDGGPQGTYSRPRRFTDVLTHADRLADPLSWRKPSRVFVNSMSDLFHEDVPDAFIDQVFAVMALAPQHTFQVLTKRPERIRAYFADVPFRQEMVGIEAERLSGLSRYDAHTAPRWSIPLPNVWLGVSVEDQQTADARIPLLLQTPAAVRFISAEPLLGPLTFRWAKWDDWAPHDRRRGQLPPVERDGRVVAGSVNELDGLRMLDWVIVGGESGPGARPCDVAWVRSIVQQCQAASVPVFVKQLGAAAFNGYKVISTGKRYLDLKDRKGADPSEWPEDLRVRQMLFRESAQ